MDWFLFYTYSSQFSEPIYVKMIYFIIWIIKTKISLFLSNVYLKIFIKFEQWNFYVYGQRRENCFKQRKII